MANLKNVVYLSKNQYNTLITTGSVTSGGVTHTYDANNLYAIPSNTLYLHTMRLYSGNGGGAAMELQVYSTSDVAVANMTQLISLVKTAVNAKMNPNYTDDNGKIGILVSVDYEVKYWYEDAGTMYSMALDWMTNRDVYGTVYTTTDVVTLA